MPNISINISPEKISGWPANMKDEKNLIPLAAR